MNDKTLTLIDKKNKHYIKALLILQDINLREIAHAANVSIPFVSYIVTGGRKGVKKKGRLVQQLIADKIGKDVNELFPRKAA